MNFEQPHDVSPEHDLPVPESIEHGSFSGDLTFSDRIRAVFGPNDLRRFLEETGLDIESVPDAVAKRVVEESIDYFDLDEEVRRERAEKIRRLAA